MAHRGTAYFDSRGLYHKTPEDATLSDLASLLGKIGDGESLAPGIAHMLLDRRTELDRIFAEHDALKQAEDEARQAAIDADNVTPLKVPRD